ncbi:MAG: hypothetical protein PQJ50_03440, partial [Spirochaetales bacterium]|nr:hypothetical protein [Spirochaetales bacterium]
MDKIQPIISTLTQIVTSLGDVYLNMADRYPELFGSLDDKLLVFKDEGGGSAAMGNVVSSINESVSRGTEYMKSIGDRDSLFLKEMKSEVSAIKKLDDYISSIEDDSAELELVSLNAMVAALKAGKNGGAFPYITEELQKVSKSSAVLSSQLNTKGSDLGEIFTSFIGSINQDKNEIEEVVDRVGKEFGRLTARTTEFQILSEKIIGVVRSKIYDIKAPLYKIISEVQKHDIVRQSVDHVILALEHISLMEVGSLEKRLDSLSYSSRVYGFCYEILDEICTELSKNLGTFKDKSGDLNTLVNYIHDSGLEMAGKGGGTSYETEIPEIQENIASSLEYLKKGSIQAVMKKNIDSIHSEIAALEESYSGFSRIISRIKTINISSRVEAAKLPHLENMSYIIDSIAERTDSLESLVESIVKTIALFKKNTSVLFDDFFERTTSDAVKVEEFALELKSNLNKIDVYSENINRKMQDL